jgi:hypothetical protein
MYARSFLVECQAVLDGGYCAFLQTFLSLLWNKANLLRNSLILSSIVLGFSYGNRTTLFLGLS